MLRQLSQALRVSLVWLLQVLLQSSASPLHAFELQGAGEVESAAGASPTVRSRVQPELALL
jgi:hypothetical protein